MPLAWFSVGVRRSRRVFHVCLSCGHEDRIDHNNLVFMSESDAARLIHKICDTCEPHFYREKQEHVRCQALDSFEVLEQQA